MFQILDSGTLTFYSLKVVIKAKWLSPFIPLDVSQSFTFHPLLLKKKDVLQQAQLRTKLLFFFYSVSLYVLC